MVREREREEVQQALQGVVSARSAVLGIITPATGVNRVSESL